jgi:hypothetical protein
MRENYILFIILFLSFSFCGCRSVPEREISPEEFIALYDRERTYGNHWDYQGKSGKYYVMVHYGHISPDGEVNGNTLPSLQEKVLVRIDRMPKDFPRIPQKEIVNPPLPDFFMKEILEDQKN